MSFIACTDKKRKKRVEASGNLPRKDYYCPNPKCSAKLVLVDCDDITRTDHFRLKNGCKHIEGCDFSKNDVKLQGNSFTTKEYALINIELQRAKENLNQICSLLNSYTRNKNHLYVYNELTKKWLAYDMNRPSHLKKVIDTFERLNEYVKTFDMNKFKYGVHSPNTEGYCWPFVFLPIELCPPLFKNVQYKPFVIQETIVHEALHQCKLKVDWKYGEADLHLSSIRKRQNADNWSSLYTQMLYQIQKEKKYEAN